MKRLVNHREWVAKLIYGQMEPEQYVMHVQSDTGIELDEMPLPFKLRKCLDMAYSEMDEYYNTERAKLIKEMEEKGADEKNVDSKLLDLIVNFDAFTTILSTCLIIMARNVKYANKGVSDDNIG